MTRKIDELRSKAALKESYLQTAAKLTAEYKDLLDVELDDVLDIEGVESDRTIQQLMDEAGIVCRNATAPEPALGAGTNKNPDSLVDVLTFCESRYYLGIRLTPWQTLILKTFYMGTPGNAHLKIEEYHPDLGCVGCIWSKNLECELEYAKTLQNKNYKTKLRVEGPANSKCLTCNRFDPKLRELRYQNLKDNALNETECEDINIFAERDLEDNFQTEMDLISGMKGGIELADNDIGKMNPIVANQILAKQGRKFQELVLVLGRRSGKLVEICTPILSTNGWTNIGDLRVGDYVFGPDGRPTQVIAKSEVVTDEDCYEMTFSNKEKIVAGKSHEWQTYTKAERKNQSRGKYSKEPKPQVFTTEEIYNTLYANKPRLLKNKGKDTYRTKLTQESNHAIKLTQPLQYLNRNDLEIHPYLLGAWLGDGSKSSSQITGIDMELFDYIENNCNHKISHSSSSAKSHGIQKHNLTQKSFVSILKAENLYGNKHIPRKYLETSIKDRLELLRGLNDTDGYVDPIKKTIEFCACNKDIADGYYELVCALGLKAVMATSDAKLYERVTSTRYRITYSVPLGWKVFNLSRKQKVLDERTATKGDTEKIFIRDCVPVEHRPLQCIQVDNADNMFLCGKSLIPTKNSFLVSVIALYEAYKFIMMDHPQKRYPINTWDEILILNVALSKDQALGAIFNKIREHVLASPFFAQFIGKVIQTDLYLLTPADQRENKRRETTGTPLLTGSIHIKSGTSNSAAQLGGTIAVIIIDEMAAMAQSNADNNSTDDALYTLLKPSIATFGFDGKIICISNPLGPFGKFYKLYTEGINDKLTLVHQLPTWLANPSIPTEYIESERIKDPGGFRMQYGAQFGAGGDEAWLSSDYILDVMPINNPDTSKRRLEFGKPMYRYNMHLDPAISSDNYTLCILHSEPIDGAHNTDGSAMNKIVVDHLHYFPPISKNQPVNVEEVEKYVIDVGHRFHIKKITYDQHWSSAGSILRFTREGFRCEMTPYVYSYINLIYQNLYDLFTSNRIEFYHIDSMGPVRKSDGTIRNENIGEISLCRNEFMQLQRKWKHGKPKIEAPSGYHDDFCDVVAGAAYQAIIAKEFQSLPRIRIARPMISGSSNRLPSFRGF